MKYLLVSPREPSGATWLINCLLELGIKTYRRLDPDLMWTRNEYGTYELNPEENILRKWLPVLTREKKFTFRDDIEVQWTHEWPIKEYSSLPVIYFVRDPRDSMYSRYKREAPGVTFTDFLHIPDVGTLLNKIDNWVLFNLYWLERKNLKVFRFEDYKQDAGSTLRQILEYINVIPEPAGFSRAIAESTSAKARESEEIFRKQNYLDGQIINRAGAVGEWKKISDRTHMEIIKKIEKKSGALFRYFGYEISQNSLVGNEIAIDPNVNILSFFAQLEFSPENVLSHHSYKTVSTIAYLRDFAACLNRKWITNCGLPFFELKILLNNLEFFYRKNNDLASENRIIAVRSELYKQPPFNKLRLLLTKLGYGQIKKMINKITR